ncbi:MAG: hypothetical protein ACF8OB_09945 [Phycisphaeraceae bacterium JB051]
MDDIKPGATQPVHHALKKPTTEEVWHANKPTKPIPMGSAVCPCCNPHIRVQRSPFGSDTNLPVIKITVHHLAA